MTIRVTWVLTRPWLDGERGPITELGTAALPHSFWPDSAAGPKFQLSTAYFCPHCGEIWARAIVRGGNTPSNKTDKRWHVSAHICPSCNGGVMWYPSFDKLGAVLPPAFLRHQLQHIDRDIYA